MLNYQRVYHPGGTLFFIFLGHSVYPLGNKKPVALGWERWQVGIFQCSLMHQDPSSFASWDTNRTRSGGSKSAD